MKQRTRARLLRVAVCTAVLALGGMAALAQPPGGRPGGGPGFGPPGGPGGPGGPGMRELTAVNVPIGALEGGLKLTATQKDKISKIQTQFQKDRQAAMPRFGGPGGPGGPPPGGGPDGPGGPPPGGGPGGGPGGPPDFEAMHAAMDKVQGLERDANKKIEAQLTSDQKSELPGVIKDIQTLGGAGIPAEVIGDLKLTADEKKQIADIVKQSRADMQAKREAAQQSGDFGSLRETMMNSQKETHDKAMAVLTDDQKAVVEKYAKTHPRPEGGPGRFGPPGGPGGFGGPPPGEGPGGPPPGGPPPGDPDRL